MSFPTATMTPVYVAHGRDKEGAPRAASRLHIAAIVALVAIAGAAGILAVGGAAKLSVALAASLLVVGGVSASHLARRWDEDLRKARASTDAELRPAAGP